MAPITPNQESNQPAFKKEVHEARELTRKSESWSAEINGYDVILVREDDDAYTISVYPNAWRQYGEPDRIRLPLLRFHPKRVEDLDALAEFLPSVLRQLAAGLRAEGLTDLRSKWDVMRDEMDAQREAWQAAAKQE